MDTGNLCLKLKTHYMYYEKILVLCLVPSAGNSRKPKMTVTEIIIIVWNEISMNQHESAKIGKKIRERE